MHGLLMLFDLFWQKKLKARAIACSHFFGFFLKSKDYDHKNNRLVSLCQTIVKNIILSYRTQ